MKKKVIVIISIIVAVVVIALGSMMVIQHMESIQNQQNQPQEQTNPGGFHVRPPH